MTLSRSAIERRSPLQIPGTYNLFNQRGKRRKVIIFNSQWKLFGATENDGEAPQLPHSSKHGAKKKRSELAPSPSPYFSALAEDKNVNNLWSFFSSILKVKDTTTAEEKTTYRLLKCDGFVDVLRVLGESNWRSAVKKGIWQALRNSLWGVVMTWLTCPYVSGNMLKSTSTSSLRGSTSCGNSINFRYELISKYWSYWCPQPLAEAI